MIGKVFQKVYGSAEMPGDEPVPAPATEESEQTETVGEAADESG